MTEINRSIPPNGYFAVLSSGIIHPHSKYELTIVTYDFVMRFKLQIHINGTDYNYSQTINIKSKGVQKLSFQMPDLKCDVYKLMVEDIERRNFRKTLELKCMPKMPMAFIVTDKAYYKIGDLMEFRVLVLDENAQTMMKMSKTNALSIDLKDAERNLMQQWKIFELENGIFNGQYRLPVDEPVLGKWTIEVKAENRQLAEKFFDFDSVSQPTLQIKIETSKNILISDNLLSINLYANCSSGEMVNGEAFLTLKIIETHLCKNVNIAENMISIENGNGSWEFKLSEKLQLQAVDNFPINLEIAASVKDEQTKAQQSVTTKVQLHSKRFQIESLNLPKRLIYGTSLTLKMVVKHFDGRPVADATNSIKLYIESYINLVNGQEDLQHEVLESLPDQFGIAHFDCTFDYSLSKIYNFRAEYLDVVKNFDTVKTVDQGFEPIILEVLTRNPKISDLIEVFTRNCDLERFFAYTIAARGKCLQTEMVELVDYRTKFIIKIMPTIQMLPKIVLLVYYNVNEELFSKHITINFDQELENELLTPAPIYSKKIVNAKFETQRESFAKLLERFLYPANDKEMNLKEIFEKIEMNKPNVLHDGCFGKEFDKNTGLITITNALYYQK